VWVGLLLAVGARAGLRLGEGHLLELLRRRRDGQLVGCKG
jgi:hypothetical protein